MIFQITQPMPPHIPKLMVMALIQGQGEEYLSGDPLIADALFGLRRTLSSRSWAGSKVSKHLPSNLAIGPSVSAAAPHSDL
jgi:hypothetical protein